MKTKYFAHLANEFKYGVCAYLGSQLSILILLPYLGANLVPLRERSQAASEIQHMARAPVNLSSSVSTQQRAVEETAHGPVQRIQERIFEVMNADDLKLNP